MKVSGPGETQRSILDLLKRGGSATIPELARELGLNIETVRGHLKALTAQALVRRESARRSGPGRPEIVYGLAPDAEALFPRREGAILRELASYLKQSGNGHILRKFIEHGIARRRDEALARVAYLEGRERIREVARGSRPGHEWVTGPGHHGSQRTRPLPDATGTRPWRTQ